jgi:hypothetical protein
VSSILTSTKKILGVEASDVDFDVEILTHINSVFSTLNQLGIGPEQGFMIEDATPTWDAFLGTDPRLNSVKTYMYLRVRMLFDPPQTSYLIDALNKQREELEWRLNVYCESTAWTDPSVTVPEEGGVLDGGDP